MSAPVAIALHTFHVTRAFLAWQTASRPVRSLERSCKYFLSRKEIALIIRGLHASSALPAGKLQKIIRSYIKKQSSSLYFNKAPKI